MIRPYNSDPRRVSRLGAGGAGRFVMFDPLHSFLFGLDGSRNDVTDVFTSELVSNPNLSNGFSPLLPLTDTDFVGQYLADLDNWSVVNTPTVFEVQQILGSVRACRITADSVGDGARTASFTAGAGTTYRTIIRHYHHNADGIRYRVYDNQNAIEEVNVLDPVPGTGYATQILTWTQTTDSNDVYLEFTAQTSSTDYSILYIDLKESGPPTSWTAFNTPSVLEHVESVNGISGTAYVDTGAQNDGVQQTLSVSRNAGDVMRFQASFYKEDNVALRILVYDITNAQTLWASSGSGDYTTAGAYSIDQSFTLPNNTSSIRIAFYQTAAIGTVVFQLDSVSLVGDIPDTWSLKNYGSAGDDAVASGADFSTFFADSRYGEFDDINDEFLTSGNLGLTGSDPFTCIVVLKVPPTGGIEYVFANNGEAVATGEFFAMYTALSTYNRIYWNFNALRIYNQDDVFADNTFYHYAITFPDSNILNAALYVNGSPINALYISSGVPRSLAAQRLKLGAFATNYFSGKMGEFHFIPRVLSADEMTRHYEKCYSKAIGLL